MLLLLSQLEEGFLPVLALTESLVRAAAWSFSRKYDMAGERGGWRRRRGFILFGGVYDCMARDATDLRLVLTTVKSLLQGTR